MRLARYYAIVRPSVARVHQSKRLMLDYEFSPYGSATPLVHAGYVSSRNTDGFALSGAVKPGSDGKQAIF